MITLVGRSSSHFTRVARMFAIELGLEHTFKPVLNIAALEASAYADNPALKIPILVDEHGPLFGAENICRAIVRRSGRRDIVLRGDSTERVVANAEELTLHVMSSEVTLILAKMVGGATPPPKVSRSIDNCLHHLDTNIDAVITALPPDRALSFVEVAMYCVVTHLPFREVMDVTRFARLTSFCDRFGERESARFTAYRFDAG